MPTTYMEGRVIHHAGAVPTAEELARAPIAVDAEPVVTPEPAVEEPPAPAEPKAPVTHPAQHKPAAKPHKGH